MWKNRRKLERLAAMVAKEGAGEQGGLLGDTLALGELPVSAVVGPSKEV